MAVCLPGCVPPVCVSPVCVSPGWAPLWLCTTLAMESHLYAVPGISNLQLALGCWRNQDDSRRKGNFADAGCSRFEEVDHDIEKTMHPYQTRPKSSHEWAVPACFQQQKTWSPIWPTSCWQTTSHSRSRCSKASAEPSTVCRDNVVRIR